MSSPWRVLLTPSGWMRVCSCTSYAEGARPPFWKPGLRVAVVEVEGGRVSQTARPSGASFCVLYDGG